jgi:hypothetical protein
LGVSRCRHVFRWGTLLLLLYRWQAVINDCFAPPKITPEGEGYSDVRRGEFLGARESGRI